MTKASVVLIGNEILSGRTEDANLPYLGKRLAELGVTLAEARTIPDLEEVIIAVVNTCRATYDYVFTTGGIGSTHDDITTRSIATAFGAEVVTHPDAVARLEAAYGTNKVNAAQLKMAEVPVGAVLLDNPISGAPGYRIENVYVMAGVPEIMQAMFEGFCHELDGGPPIHSRTVSAKLRESQLAQGMEELQDRYPLVSIGSYPFYRQGHYGVDIVLRATELEILDRVEAEISELVRKTDR